MDVPLDIVPFLIFNKEWNNKIDSKEYLFKIPEKSCYKTYYLFLKDEIMRFESVYQ